MNPMQFLSSIDQQTGAAFQALRQAVGNSGTLDERVCELIVTASFVVTGQGDSFKVHGKRAMALGATAADLRQAVLVTLGATTTFAQVVAALHWIDDIGAS
jgi:alkylhydroperoxidase/carboxymuconolactone decarboxylase family protein YurZ